MIRLSNLYLRSLIINKRRFHTSNYVSTFSESHRSGYPSVLDKLPGTDIDNLSLLEKFKIAHSSLKDQFKLLGKEIGSYFTLYPDIPVPHEEYIVWKFNEGIKSRSNWIVNYDSDYDLGHSTAKLDVSSNGTGIFHGTLNVTVPKDGQIRRAGYCNITTIPKLKSFYRKGYYDWSEYNHLVLRVRGDGRCYMLNILQKGYFDLCWFDCYSFFIYTRGGPYWQKFKIPFSKFAFAYKGYLQDAQRPLPQFAVTNFGITLADKKPGPFKLEIDYIAVCNDPSNDEESAYEANDMHESYEAVKQDGR